MLSVVVRIYRIEEKNRKLIGTAQAVNSDQIFSFSDMNELWFILYSQFNSAEQAVNILFDEP